MLVVCFLFVSFIDLSRTYHYVRRQSVIKIYVLFNMLQMFERLLCSLGQDILHAVISVGLDKQRRVTTKLGYFILACVYTGTDGRTDRTKKSKQQTQNEAETEHRQNGQRKRKRTSTNIPHRNNVEQNDEQMTKK